MLLALMIAGAIGLKRLGYDEFALLRRGTILNVYEAPVLRRSMFVVFVDIAFVCLAAYVAVALKTDDWLLKSERALALRLAIFMVPLSITVFWKAKLYDGSWLIARIDDFARASMACATVVVVALIVYSWQLQSIPVSLMVVYGLVSTALVVGSRASYRVLVSAQLAPGPEATPALLYGPGPKDVVQARNLIDRAGSFGLRPVGFVTSTDARGDQWLAGLRVCGSIEDLPRVTRSSGARAVIFASSRATEATVTRFEELCRLSNVVPYRLNTQLDAMSDDGIEARRMPQPLLFEMRRQRRPLFVVNEADG